MFLRILTAHANSHATSRHVMHRARALITKMNNEQTAIATALLGINDLGRSVTTTFLFTIMSSLSKTEQKMESIWEVHKI